MLEHLHLPVHAKMIKDSVDKVLRTGKCKTKDMGGHATTKTYVQAIIENLHH